MKSSPILLALFLFVSCSTATNDGGGTDENATESVSEPVVEEKPAVCIWNNISVRAEPSAKSKWITSISIGEELTYLGKSAIDSTDKNREYLNIRLADDTEGWSVSDFIVIDGTVAVLLEDKDIYKRPDLLTKSDRAFDMLDIIAISAEQGDWLEVVGKRADGKWIQKGWIKDGELSKKPIDVAVAKFAAAALELESKEAQMEALVEILNNSDFSSSYFITFVEDKLNELQLEEDLTGKNLNEDSAAME